MRLDLTGAMQRALLCQTWGYTAWVAAGPLPDPRAEAVLQKWRDNYGTNLPAHKRHWRKTKKLANAHSFICPEIGRPGYSYLYLYATPDALLAKPPDKFSTEAWRTTTPEIQGYYCINERREVNGSSSLTWKMPKSELQQLADRLKYLIIRKDGRSIAIETKAAVSFYPLFGGVRRQLKRLFFGAKKLWEAKNGTPWPGQDPNDLPAMIGFRAAKPKFSKDND